MRLRDCSLEELLIGLYLVGDGSANTDFMCVERLSEVAELRDRIGGFGLLLSSLFRCSKNRVIASPYFKSLLVVLVVALEELRGVEGNDVVEGGFVVYGLARNPNLLCLLPDSLHFLLVVWVQDLVEDG